MNKIEFKAVLIALALNTSLLFASERLLEEVKNLELTIERLNERENSYLKSKQQLQ